jgi:hypothetical protein
MLNSLIALLSKIGMTLSNTLGIDAFQRPSAYSPTTPDFLDPGWHDHDGF